MRRLASGVLLAVLAAPCPPAPVCGAAPPAPRAATRQRLVALLRKTVDFEGIDDPATRLSSVLEQLARAHGVTFVLNEQAVGRKVWCDLLATQIADPSPIPPMKVTFAELLEAILGRVETPSGIAFLLRRDHIELTTGKAAGLEVWGRHYTPPPPGFSLRRTLVHLAPENVPLACVLADLADQAGVNVVIDPKARGQAKVTVTAELLNAPPDTALLVLTALADLSFVRLDNSFLVTTPAKAEALRKAHQAMRRAATNNRPANPGPMGKPGAPGAR
jgi:hypothetical protein